MGRHSMADEQISANKTTPLRYSKITRYSGIIPGRISCRSGGNNSTQIIFELELLNLAFKFGFHNLCFMISRVIVIIRFSIRVWTVIFELVPTGLVFVLPLSTILGFHYRASTRPRTQTFKIRLEIESRVGTPLRQNLLWCLSSYLI